MYTRDEPEKHPKEIRVLTCRHSRKSTMSDVTALSNSQKRCAPRLLHSHNKFVFSDTAEKSALSDVAALSGAQRRCAPRHSHNQDKSAFRGTAKNKCLVTLQRSVMLRKDVHPGSHTATNKFVLSDTARKTAFSDAQKVCAPRHVLSHNKSTFSDTAKKATFSDVAAFSHITTTSPRLVTRKKTSV